MPTTERTTIHCVCPLDCPDTCAMRVTVEDGVAVDLRGNREHPFTRGFLCQKMARYLDRVYSPDRLLHPLKRVGPKGSGRFERVGWDEALNAIADRASEMNPSLGNWKACASPHDLHFAMTLSYMVPPDFPNSWSTGSNWPPQWHWVFRMVA